MLIDPPKLAAPKVDPLTATFSLAQAIQALSVILINQGKGAKGDLIELVTVILVANPDGTINVENSRLDVTIYPGSGKPEAQT